MKESIPKTSRGDKDHPEVSKIERSSIDDHPHQRHEVDSEGRLPGKTHERCTTLNTIIIIIIVLLHFNSSSYSRRCTRPL